MELIIQPEEVGTLARPISQHIDREQLVAYITEVEQLQIRSALGGALFSNIKQSPSAFSIILNGGIDECGEVSGGIRKAMAYYVYARIIREGGTIATRFGAVEKNDEYATRLEQERKNTIHRECVNIADTYMAEVIRYAKAQGWMTAQGANPTRKMAYVVGEERPKSKTAPTPTVKTEVDIVQGEGILINGNIVSVDFSSVASMGIVTDVEAKADEAKEVATEAQEIAERAFSGISDNTEAVVGALTKANNAEKKATATSTALEAEVAERKAQDTVMDKRITDVEVNVSDISKRATTAETKAAEIETAISDLKVATQVNYGEIQQVKHDAESTLSMVLDNSRAIQQHTKDIDKNAQDVVSNTQAINLLAEVVETKQDELTLTVLDNGNIRIGNLQGQTKDFMPATPSGDPMHYAYIAVGAEWNDTDQIIQKTAPWGTDEKWRLEDDGTYTYWEEPAIVDHIPKHWYLNGIGDIGNGEMGEIYANGRLYVGSDISNLYSTRARTALVCRKSGSEGRGFSLYYMLGYYCTIIILTTHHTAYASTIHRMSNENTTRILPKIKMNTTSPSNVSSAFSSAHNLLECVVSAIKVSINYGRNPKIYKRCILTVIQECEPTSAITITLHPDAYARIANQPDIIEALEAKNAELASTGGSIALVSA